MANAKKKRQAGEGKVLLAAPKKVSSCSAHGVEYKVDRDGLVEVDQAHAAALIDHGFSEPDFESDAEDAPKDPPKDPPAGGAPAGDPPKDPPTA